MSVALPNYHALGVLILIGITLYLYARENLSVETVSLGVLAVMALGFELFPFTDPAGRVIGSMEFFSGFGHRALIGVLALIILAHGLIRSGALEPVGRLISACWKKSASLGMVVTLVVCGALSMLINNTPLVVMLLPVLLGVAIRTGVPASSILLPVGLISIVGGMATTVGTSTNLLVVGVAEDLGVARFQMFDFIVPVLIAGAVAVVYLWLAAPRLLPERQAPMQARVDRLYTAQIRLNRGGSAVGLTLSEAIERCDGLLKVEGIQRGPGVFVAPLPDVVLKAGDRLTTTSTQDNLREFARRLDGTLYSGDYEVDEEHPLTADDQIIAEIAITPSSRLVGVRIGQARLLSRYGLRLLALHRFERQDRARATDLDNTVLRSGDVLLIQGSSRRLNQHKKSGDFLVLDGSVNLPRTGHAPAAVIIMGVVILIAALGFIPIYISAVLGVFALILTRCLSWKETLSALSIRTFMIIVTSLALALALTRTGGGEWLARVSVLVAGDWPAAVLLGALMLIVALLTNVAHNNVVGLVFAPVAIALAQQLGLPAEPFVLAVIFGANLSYATPMAYQTNLLVMNAGGYKFNDFVRVGVPLLVLMWLVLTALLVYAYGI